MDKNRIKNFLTDRFLTEARAETNTPGISVTKAVQKQEAKINKDAVKADLKNVKDADKVTSTSKSEPVKYNYNSDKEKEYHEEMEILNGQEMIEYDREPNDLFKDKAKEAIVGSTRMGNKAGKDHPNTTATWGASDDNFGKDLVKRIKSSTKKRNDAYDRVISFGDDIETVPKGSKPMAKHSALKENRDIYEYHPMGSEEENEFNNDQKTKDPKEINEYSSDYEMGKWVPPSDEHKKLMDKAVKDSGDREEAERAKKRSEAKSQKENNNNKKPQIKESMKRLKFNKLFDGVGNALKMIPESYKTDNKVFEMTDGNESYKIRWEGTLTEGKAIVLMASDKTMINEDMAHMKHLMGYKSQETLGTVKGKARLDENVVFNDIWAKTKTLLEAEEIEGKKAPKGEWDKINMPQAKEAKKDVEGSVSEDKGTKAPKVKTSSGEELDSAKKQAPEAKKHVEGSVNAEIGMGLGETSPEGEWDQINVPVAAATPSEPAKTAYAKAPATGVWDKIAVPHAQDAKKHISMKEGIELGGIVFKPINFVIKENDGAKKKIAEDDNKNAENKFKEKIKRGERTQAEYDEWIKNKGKFAEESVNEEEKPYNPIDAAHAEYESPADKKFKSDEWVKAQKDAK